MEGRCIYFGGPISPPLGPTPPPLGRQWEGRRRCILDLGEKCWLWAHKGGTGERFSKHTRMRFVGRCRYKTKGKGMYNRGG